MGRTMVPKKALRLRWMHARKSGAEACSQDEEDDADDVDDPDDADDADDVGTDDDVENEVEERSQDDDPDDGFDECSDDDAKVGVNLDLDSEGELPAQSATPQPVSQSLMYI